MVPPSEISKTERIPELRNEIHRKYPESKRDLEEWNKYKEALEKDRDSDQEKNPKKKMDQVEEDHELGKDPNLGDELDITG